MKEITKRILEKRGIDTDEEREEFLSPRPKKNYDPLLLRGMREGVDMVLSAVDKGEKITIYGDYDADGVTATVVLLTILSAMGAKVSYYIPSRFDEGYGLNKEALTKIRNTGTSLVISVDCGCNAFEEVEHAKEIGLDILITDHHNCEEGVPDTVVIDPKQAGCPYPFKGLAGCGVAYKLALALRDAAGLPKSVTAEVLDMVAIGTIGDVVPLVDENRTLVKYGLSIVNERRRPGLRGLLNAISMGDRLIGSEDVSFGIVPNINAAGRMAAAKLGVQLFVATDENEIRDLAERMVRCNVQRKTIQQQILKQCLDLRREYIDNYLFPVIVAEGAHEGITGIVAGRLREVFNRPIAIVVPGEDGLCKGTSRSVDRVDLYELLSAQDYLFERFGGHKKACGFTIREENVEELREALNETMVWMKEEDPHILEPLNPYDIEAPIAALDVELVKELELLGPFGSENEKPRFAIRGVSVDRVMFMGSEGQHMRVNVSQESGGQAECVLFSATDEQRDLLIVGKKVDLVCELSVNEWQGRESLQLMIRGVYQHAER